LAPRRPPGPAIIIANEFFDALPVRQAIKLADGWHERVVKVDDAGKFRFGLVTDCIPQVDRLLPPNLHAAPIGALYEWRPETTSPARWADA
jgi:NADH dehydrogenase [ubiquinone] 1 alpha subcomplex assembly factor 7